jgi:hypothetical protein
MLDQRAILRPYADHFRRELAKLEALNRQERTIDPLIRYGGGVALNEALGITRRTGTSVTRALLAKERSAGREKIETEATYAFDHVKSLLRTMSRTDIPLKAEGNSPRLVTSFQSTLRASRLETKLRRAADKLDELVEMPLIANTEITAYLSKDATPERQQFDRSMSAIEKVTPSIAAMLKGAEDALLSRRRDSCAQCVASCRRAVEAAAMHASGTDSWDAACATLRRNPQLTMLKNVWGFLSNTGSHGNKTPARPEGEQALLLSVGAIRGILGV